MTRTLSAPGKLFLSGEYAVLWGGVARIAAVGPRVLAQSAPRVDRRVQLILEDGSLSGEATHAGVHWDRELPAEFLFAARTVDLLFRAVHRDGPGLALAMAPSPVSATGRKLGLGSSARAVVLAAEAARSAIDAPVDTLKLSLLAHAQAQGGKGSGGDVAASFAGGILRYRRYDLGALQSAATAGALGRALAGAAPVEVSRLTDARLPLVYAFSGQSASTGSLISQIEGRWAPGQREAFVARSDQLGLQLEEGLVRGDFRLAAEAASALEQLLAGLGPLETQAMRDILALAGAYGCAGKMSGAGGGDGCVILCPDEGHRVALLEGLAARKIEAMPLTVEPGLRGEAVADPTLSGWLEAARDR